MLYIEIILFFSFFKISKSENFLKIQNSIIFENKNIFLPTNKWSRIYSQLGIAHRDLKLENLLLTEDKILKYIDFGLSHEFTEDVFLKTKCGSPSYAAPEIIAKPKYDGFKNDIWCYGIILYANLYGYLPFDGDNDSEKKIFNYLETYQNMCLKCQNFEQILVEI